MILSRIQVENFRNFSKLDVSLSGNIVIVGENKVGKSNLLHALRLIFDPSLPDNARQLGLSDFWDGLGAIEEDDKIKISVDIVDFDDDLDLVAVLTDYRLDSDPDTVRLNYVCGRSASVAGPPKSDEDLEFVCYGGDSPKKRFGHDVRRRLTMDLLPALRDAEGDLAAWRRSPLRPLVEEAFGSIDPANLKAIGVAISNATDALTDFQAIDDLESNLATLLMEMSGPKQDIKPKLGFGATEVTRLYRNIRLLIDDGKRAIGDASLGSANIVFLALKSLELARLIQKNKRDHTLLAIEEPEAHLHPHLQRSVYRNLFDVATDDDEASPMSIVVTTHSPHIASVAPLRSLVLLKDTQGKGTVGRSTATLRLSKDDIDDLQRYLDVTRAEMLFARGVVLVEGDAEKFLVPSFADAMGHSLDKLGVSVCSVSGTNFLPYVKLLSGLHIPFAVITDWDPMPASQPLAINRGIKIAATIEAIRTGKLPTKLIKELRATDDLGELSDSFEDFGVFTNDQTLEVDLFEGVFWKEIIETLRETKWSIKRQQFLDELENDPDVLDAEEYLKLIEAVGKGRFAQRLASRIVGKHPPKYIKKAIDFVVKRV